MATGVPPKKNTALVFYAGLVSQANTNLLQVNPTIAAGDFKVSTDGGTFNNLATLPVVTPAGGTAVKFSLSSGECNGDDVVVQCVDAAGAEWCDRIIAIKTAARWVDDLAFPVTTGNPINSDGSGNLTLTATERTNISNVIGTRLKEGSLTEDMVDRIILAACSQKADGFPGPSTVHYRDVADSKNRITATVDASGNRTVVVVDGT